MNPRLRSAVFVVLVFLAALAGVWAGMGFRESRAPGPPSGESELVAGREFPEAALAAPDGASRRTGELLAGRGLYCCVNKFGTSCKPAPDWNCPQVYNC